LHLKRILVADTIRMIHILIEKTPLKMHGEVL